MVIGHGRAHIQSLCSNEAAAARAHLQFADSLQMLGGTCRKIANILSNALVQFKVV